MIVMKQRFNGRQRSSIIDSGYFLSSIADACLQIEDSVLSVIVANDRPIREIIRSFNQLLVQSMHTNDLSISKSKTKSKDEGKKQCNTAYRSPSKLFCMRPHRLVHSIIWGQLDELQRLEANLRYHSCDVMISIEGTMPVEESHLFDSCGPSRKMKMFQWHPSIGWKPKKKISIWCSDANS